MKISARILLCSAATLFMLSGCDILPDWLGGEDDKPPLAGVRVPVLSDIAQAKPDTTLAQIPVTVPAPLADTSWPEQGGGASGLTGNLAWSGATHHDRRSIGDGNAWHESGNLSPVVANGMVFAMDAVGYITAHDALDIDKIKWTNKDLVEEDEPDLMGGGLAVDAGKLYVTSGYGKVAAFDIATGKQKWKITLGVPMRNAPKAIGGRVFVLSVDNEMFVLDAITGKQLWNHRGITENVGFITSVAPSVKDTIVLAPYSSGEIHALDTGSGQEIWSDTLILSRHTTATGGFSGIGGAPVIADDTVYTGDSGGFFAAITLLSGRRVWEQDIPTLNPAWVAGDFIYLLSDTDMMVCLYKADGRVKWTHQLARYEDEVKRKGPYVWRGPIMAGGQLLVSGQHGQLVELSPKDGSLVTTIDIPEDITDVPVVAGGRMYFVTQDARLHSLY